MDADIRIATESAFADQFLRQRMSSSGDDTQLDHFTLSQRVTSWISQNIFGELVYTCRHGLLQGMKRKGGLGWLPKRLSASVENAEIQFWRSLDLTDKVVYDVGSYHGLLAMYFARSSRLVVCFEPNDVNRTRLEENVALNRLTNVTVRAVGIGSEPADVTMVYSPLMSGGATIETAHEFGPRATAGTVRQSIRLSSLDAEIAAGIALPDFIKIDVEGYELEALVGAAALLATHRPELFLEMHGNTVAEKRKNVAAIVTFLEHAAYVVKHVESGSLITAENASLAMEGHLYARPVASSLAQAH